MLGQYVFAGMKLERLLFIALIQHALFHPATCPVLNSWEYQRTVPKRVHHLKSQKGMSDDTTKEIVKLDTAICIWSQKATTSEIK